jgi:hypothetical protein
MALVMKALEWADSGGPPASARSSNN